MSKASDVIYGRQGGRIVAPSTSGKAWHQIVPCKPNPTTETELRAHLLGPHECTAEVLDAATPDAWAEWHDAWHRLLVPERRQPLHTGHLQHTHRQYLPKPKSKETS